DAASLILCPKTFISLLQSKLDVSLLYFLMVDIYRLRGGKYYLDSKPEKTREFYLQKLVTSFCLHDPCRLTGC
uniref:Uncharacterized protein n=1 Tax=Spermophilus dauricus TaxID=99837 RepID=A0A8C9P7Z2_SPEDA